MSIKYSFIKITLAVAASISLIWALSTLITRTCRHYRPRRNAYVKSVASKMIMLGKSWRWSGKKCWTLSVSGSENLTLTTLNVSTKSYPNGIPKLIHTTWKTGSLTKNWNIARKRCSHANKGFVYCHWTDRELLWLVASEYPEFLERFLQYPYPIQRADAGRYLILHRIGGFYRDVNVGCKVSFDRIYTNETRKHSLQDDFIAFHETPFRVLLTQGTPFGVTGEFMASVPGHPFFGHVIESLRGRRMRYGLPYLDVMLGTGPLFLTSAYLTFTAASAPRSKLIKDEVRVIESKDLKYFNFLGGSTWHCVDGTVLWFLFQHASFVGTVLAFIVSYLLRCRIISIAGKCASCRIVPARFRNSSVKFL